MHGRQAPHLRVVAANTISQKRSEIFELRGGGKDAKGRDFTGVFDGFGLREIKAELPVHKHLRYRRNDHQNGRYGTAPARGGREHHLGEFRDEALAHKF